MNKDQEKIVYESNVVLSMPIRLLDDWVMWW